MATDPVPTLIGAVRRRLWWGQVVAGVRLAAWGSAALLLLAVAVHLLARTVSVTAVVAALALLWALLLARAAWRRPEAPACALWADRHLDGASAFTTWLEMAPGRPAAAQAPPQARAQALHWLDQWARARVPQALHMLTHGHESPRLARPLLSMAVCAALAILVLTLPGPALTVAQPLAASAPAGLDNPPPSAGDPAMAADPLGEIASALRAAAPEPDSSRAGNGRTAATGAAKGDDATGPAPDPAGAQGARTAADAAAPAGRSADAASAAGATQAAGTGAGRNAGDSRDERAGASQVPRSSIAVQRSELMTRNPSSQRQADMDQLATYDDEPSTPGMARVPAHPAVAAATPPPATESTRLTPSEANYVQAWMKASGGQR